MNKEYRKRLFALMDEIDDLAKMGIHLEKEEVTGEVEMLQEPEKAQPKIEVKKSKIDDIPEEPTGPNHDTTRRYSANFKKCVDYLVKMNTGNAAEKNGKTQGHSEKKVHGMRTNQSTKMAICSWMVKSRRLKRKGAIRWKNCTKAICLR